MNENNGRRNIRRALISVYDKTGLEELATGLHEAGVSIVSTGSTASKIAAAGVPVTEVEQLTGFPEVLEGRVKTLHPRVHAGILADTRKDDHLQQLEQLEVEAFELVVVNLYPFVETVGSGATGDAVVERDVLAEAALHQFAVHERQLSRNVGAAAVDHDRQPHPQVGPRPRGALGKGRDKAHRRFS